MSDSRDNWKNLSESKTKRSLTKIRLTKIESTEQ